MKTAHAIVFAIAALAIGELIEQVFKRARRKARNKEGDEREYNDRC
jgi:hypothetical protein